MFDYWQFTTSSRVTLVFAAVWHNFAVDANLLICFVFFAVIVVRTNFIFETKTASKYIMAVNNKNAKQLENYCIKIKIQ
jgi:hypothetical protein